MRHSRLSLAPNRHSADHTPHLTRALPPAACRRYLYLLPHTHVRMAEVTETTLRLRRARNMDLRLQVLYRGPI